MKDQGSGAAIVVAAIAINLTLGIAYIWSVFQSGIAASVFQGNNAGAALAFSLLLAMLGIGGVLGGRLAAKYSIKHVIFIGGLLIAGGFFLASFSSTAFPQLLWLSYGIMAGIGMGFTYSTSIACAQKWYPHKRGLVTGAIVAALGFGGVVFTPIIERLIKSFGAGEVGVGELMTFRILSLVYIIVCSLAALVLKDPPVGWMMDSMPAAGGAAPSLAKSYTPAEVLRNPAFWFMTLTFTLGCMGGLMMIAFAKPIAIAKDLAATATIGVLAISLFNSLGRLTWGFVSDKIGRPNTIITLLAGTAVLSLCVNAVEGNMIFVLIALIGFLYGGYLGTFPVLCSDLFGPQHQGTNYGFVLFGFGIGAILASQIAGYYRNIATYPPGHELAARVFDTSLMFPAFIIASICAAVGIALMFGVKAEFKRRKDKAA